MANNEITDLLGTMGKSILSGELRKQANKFIAKADKKDVAEGRALNALADAVDSIDFTSNPTSLNNIGKALVAAGTELQTQVANMTT